MTTTQELIARLRTVAKYHRTDRQESDDVTILEAADALEALQAEVARLDAGWQSANRLALENALERDSALARLAEIEAREACNTKVLQDMHDDDIQTINRLKGHIKHIGNDALRTENAVLKLTLQAAQAEIARLAEIGAQNPKFTMGEWMAHARNHRWRFDEEQVIGVGAPPQPVQPASAFKKLSDSQVIWLAQSHGIEGNPLSFYADLISTQPVQPSRDHRGEIIDVLCDDVFGEKYESPQPVQPTDSRASVDSAALKLALSVLRGAGKDVTADALHESIQPVQPSPAQPDTWIDDGGWEFPIIAAINARGDV